MWWHTVRMGAILFPDHNVQFKGKNSTKQKTAKTNFHRTDILHHSKCCILYADNENEPSDPLGLLQMKKKTSFRHFHL